MHLVTVRHQRGRWIPSSAYISREVGTSRLGQSCHTVALSFFTFYCCSEWHFLKGRKQPPALPSPIYSRGRKDGEAPYSPEACVNAFACEDTSGWFSARQHDSRRAPIYLFQNFNPSRRAGAHAQTYTTPPARAPRCARGAARPRVAGPQEWAVGGRGSARKRRRAPPRRPRASCRGHN